MRLIDAIGLKQALAVSAILDDNKTIEQIIDEQPTIKSEREKGKWINHRNDKGHNIADCSECGGTMQWFDPDTRPNFCPDCGADMRESEEK